MILISLLVISYKISFHILIKTKELFIFREVFFFKIVKKKFIPNNVLIIEYLLTREKISAKYPGGFVIEYIYKLEIYESISNKKVYEKFDSEENLEYLGTFICDSLNLKLNHKFINLDNSHLMWHPSSDEAVNR